MGEIARQSQTDAVVEELKRFFLSDAIRVGDKLPTEKCLCETYLVGRSTVREAIRTLQVMGYVELRPGKGAFLAAKNLSRFDSALLSWNAEHRPGLEETIRIRSALDGLAVRFAIENGTKEDLARIDLARMAFEGAVVRGEGEALASLDDAFHRTIILAGHSELLALLDLAVGVSYGEWRGRSLVFSEYGGRLVVPYQRITLAILGRDLELAELQMRRHLEQVGADMRAGVRHG